MAHRTNDIIRRSAHIHRIDTFNGYCDYKNCVNLPEYTLALIMGHIAGVRCFEHLNLCPFHEAVVQRYMRLKGRAGKKVEQNA